MPRPLQPSVKHVLKRFSRVRLPRKSVDGIMKGKTWPITEIRSKPLMLSCMVYQRSKGIAKMTTSQSGTMLLRIAQQCTIQTMMETLNITSNDLNLFQKYTWATIHTSYTDVCCYNLTFHVHLFRKVPPFSEHACGDVYVKSPFPLWSAAIQTCSISCSPSTWILLWASNVQTVMHTW